MEQLQLQLVPMSAMDWEAREPDVQFNDNDILAIREHLLIETVKSAFGESRGGRDRAPSDEAWDWIVSGESELPFSYQRCCLACGIDADELLQSLLYIRRSRLN